jgi:CheY-like chemotaxis protein
MSADSTQASATGSLDEGSGLLCRAIEDFYSASARGQGRVYLSAFMEEHHTTPLEVLHSTKHLTALGSHAQLEGMISSLADRQAGLLHQTVAARHKTLQELFKSLSTTVTSKLKAHPPAIVSAIEFSDMVRQATNKDSAESRFAVFATLAQTLFSCRDRFSKFDMLIGFAERAGETPPALEFIDALLGEHLCARGFARELWKAPENLNDLLVELVALYQNSPFKNPTPPTIMRRLQALLNAHSMPQTREAIVTIMHGALRSQERLITSDPNDLMGKHLPLLELMATADLATSLKGPDGFLGGKITHDILDRRVALLISTDKLQELTRGKSIVEKLRDLFQLQHAVATTSSTKSIDEYIVHLMENRDFMGRLSDAVDEVEERLRVLAELQMLVLGSTFTAAERKRLATMLDRLQHDQLKTTTLFSALRKEAKPPISAVLRVIDLAGEGVFTHGKCIAEARELIRRHSRHRDFVRKYLAGKDLDRGPVPEGEEKASPPIGERLSGLARRMSKAGVEFRDLSSLTVLVVEDEESARDYMEMVLRDMGVGNVMTAHDGRAALEVFGDFEDGIDLIICDWKMPRMTGIDFLKQVRSVKPKLPFLMVTALATVENVQAAMAHDVTAYIAKPFPPEQLEEKVLLLVNRANPEEVGMDPPAPPPSEAATSAPKTP